MGQIHRFRDQVGASFGNGSTCYLTAPQAEQAGGALLAAARSIRREEFKDSRGLTVEFETQDSYSVGWLPRDSDGRAVGLPDPTDPLAQLSAELARARILLRSLYDEATDWQEALSGERDGFDQLMTAAADFLGADALPAAADQPPTDPEPVWIVLYGSVGGGFKAHGPFPSERAAGDWGEAIGEGGEVWIPVHPVPADGSCPALYPWDPEPAAADSDDMDGRGIGARSICARCDQEIEFHGDAAGWLGRGGISTCAERFRTDGTAEHRPTE